MVSPNYLKGIRRSLLTCASTTVEYRYLSVLEKSPDTLLWFCVTYCLLLLCFFLPCFVLFSVKQLLNGVYEALFFILVFPQKQTQR